MVISLREVLGVRFFFFEAEIKYPDLLTIGKLKRANYQIVGSWPLSTVEGTLAINLVKWYLARLLTKLSRTLMMSGCIFSLKPYTITLRLPVPHLKTTQKKQIPLTIGNPNRKVVLHYLALLLHLLKLFLPGPIRRKLLFKSPLSPKVTINSRKPIRL